MTYQLPAAHRNHGFVLVTGLVFLVVMTLLAVSTMNSTTLQERMSSNYRDRGEALEASEAALRDAESLIVDLTKPVAASDADDDAYWAPGDLTKGNPDNVTVFLDPDLWEAGAAQASKKYGADSGAPDLTGYSGADGELPAPRYFIEMAGFDRSNSDLSPDRAARNLGTQMYRVTARAEGASPGSVIVLQSFFRRHFD